MCTNVSHFIIIFPDEDYALIILYKIGLKKKKYIKIVWLLQKRVAG
jgi:hypothetical protein